MKIKMTTATKLTLLIVFLLYTSTLSIAQEIFFSKTYNDNGEPIDPILSKKIKRNQSVSILFRWLPGKEHYNEIILYVDLVNKNSSKNLFNKIIKLPKNKNWIAYNYKFVQDGAFSIYFTDREKNKIASAQLIVSPEQTVVPPNETTPDKYQNVEVLFCERVVENKPVLIKRNVSLSNEGGLIYFFITNNQPLDTDKILVNLWRKGKYSIDYDEFLEARKYQISRDWNDTYFRYKFIKPGDYKIYIYDEKEILLKTAYIIVDD